MPESYTTITHTIEARVYDSPDGPTCCLHVNGRMCPKYATTRYGLEPFCSYHQSSLRCYRNGDGFVIPHKKCLEKLEQQEGSGQ